MQNLKRVKKSMKLNWNFQKRESKGLKPMHNRGVNIFWNCTGKFSYFKYAGAVIQREAGCLSEKIPYVLILQQKDETHIYSISLVVSCFEIPNKTQSPLPMELITSPSTVK